MAVEAVIAAGVDMAAATAVAVGMAAVTTAVMTEVPAVTAAVVTSASK